MDLEKLKNFLVLQGQPKFRLAQIKKAVYEDGVSSFLEISTLPESLRSVLEKESPLLSFSSGEILVSRNCLSVKALLEFSDGNFIETVLMSAREGNWTVCVSSQAGCPLGCEFCATGKNGFKRNLTAEEISDQVLFWKQYLKNNLTPSPSSYKGEGGSKITNVVYMGMGEPFLNWENVKKSILDLTDPKLFGFGARSISVSTAGIPEGIEKMAEELPQINLAISLHFVENKKRSRFMPINQKYDLEDLRQALRKYFFRSKRKVMLEYILLSKINDSLEDAKELADYVKSIGKLQLLHVNLIVYNSSGGEFQGSSRETASRFKDYLLQNRINVTQRKSLGAEIQGACGQLAGKTKNGK